jgi:hypothetical protein
MGKVRLPQTSAKLADVIIPLHLQSNLKHSVQCEQRDMDVVKAVETYIIKMVSVPPAMKVLLLDSHTVRDDASIPAFLNQRRSVDSNSVPGLNAVNPSITPSLPH